MMRKILSILLIYVLSCTLLAASGESADPSLMIQDLHDATEEELSAALERIDAEQRTRLKATIVLDQNEASLIKGKSLRLTPKIVDLPKDLIAGAYFWSTSDETVAIVDQKGNVKGISAGSAIITCSCVLSNEITIHSDCAINVYVPVSRVTVKSLAIRLTRGATMEINATATPRDATDLGLVYETSDNAVAVVSDAGIITALETGECTVTISSRQDPDKKVQVKVTVLQEVQGITLASMEGALITGKSITVKADIQPEDAANKKLEWSSADETIAVVDTFGRITGKSAGTTIITAKSMDGTNITATYKLKVIQPMKKITAAEQKLVLAAGTSWRQSVIIQPESTSNKTILWASSDESIATVDNSGTITGNAVGKCQITGIAEDGGGAKVTISLEVREFDYVLTTPDEIKVSFETEETSSIMFGVTSRGAIQRKEERVTDFGNGCVRSDNPKMIVPVKAGADTITVKYLVNNRVTNKEQYTVFVAQSAVDAKK